MKKRLLALCLVLLLLLPLVHAANDAPSDWAKSEVAEAITLGLVPQQLQERYQTQITRAEFCQLIVQFAEAKTGQSIEELLRREQLSLPAAFLDCNASYVLQASALGFVKGTGNGNFAPEDSLTREQAASILSNIHTSLRTKVSRTDETRKVYALLDYQDCSDWAVAGIQFALQAQSNARVSIMTGTAAHRFSPKEAFTIEQAIVTVLHMNHALTYHEPGTKIARHSDVSKDYLWAAGYHDERFGFETEGFLFAREGGFTYAVITAEQVTVQQLDEDLALTKAIAIPIELDAAIYVHLGSDGNFYLAFKSTNPGQSLTKEVLRLVAYDANWTRLRAASVSAGAIITEDLMHIASISAADNGTYLTIHTNRRRFLTDDGLRHQSNLTFSFDLRDLSLVYASPEFPRNHVSHSLAQTMLYDGDRLVTVDHGDGFPRALVLHTSTHDLQNLERFELFQISGAYGDNTTGVTLGSLAQTSKHYLTSFHTVDQSGALTAFVRNAMVAVFPRNAASESDVRLLALTQFPSTGAYTANVPMLVDLGDDRVAAIWDVYRQDGERVSYVETQLAILDADGKLVGDITRSNHLFSIKQTMLYDNGMILAPHAIYPDRYKPTCYTYINQIPLR